MLDAPVSSKADVARWAEEERLRMAFDKREESERWRRDNMAPLTATEYEGSGDARECIVCVHTGAVGEDGASGGCGTGRA